LRAALLNKRNAARGVRARNQNTQPIFLLARKSDLRSACNLESF